MKQLTAQKYVDSVTQEIHKAYMRTYAVAPYEFGMIDKTRVDFIKDVITTRDGFKEKNEPSLHERIRTLTDKLRKTKRKKNKHKTGRTVKHERELAYWNGVARFVDALKDAKNSDLYRAAAERHLREWWGEEFSTEVDNLFWVVDQVYESRDESTRWLRESIAESLGITLAEGPSNNMYPQTHKRFKRMIRKWVSALKRGKPAGDIYRQLVGMNKEFCFLETEDLDKIVFTAIQKYVKA